MSDLHEKIQRLSYSIIMDRRYKYYDLLRKNLRLNNKEMRDLQNKYLSNLIQYAYNSTRYYRDLMNSHHIIPSEIRSKEDLLHFPILTKSIIRDNLDRIKSQDSFANTLKEVTSGGSTGNQALIYKSSYFEQYSRAAFLRNNLILNWHPHDKSVWIWGAPYEHEQIEKSVISRFGLFINRRCLLNAYKYSVDDFSVWIKRIKQFRPKIIYGYASILLEFSKYLIVNKIFLDSIQRVVSTTEKLTDRETIKKAFKCPVSDQYGSREILSIAIESDEGIQRVSDDTVVLNINNNGEIILTALQSLGFPLINYQIGDQGENVVIEHPDDSWPFSSFRLSIGRLTDNFLAIGDKKVSSSALGAYLSTFRLSILEQQIIQNNYKQFDINVVPDKQFNQSKYREILYHVLSEYFGFDVEFTINIVTCIPVETSGKRLMFKRTFNFTK